MNAKHNVTKCTFVIEATTIAIKPRKRPVDGQTIIVHTLSMIIAAQQEVVQFWQH